MITQKSSRGDLLADGDTVSRLAMRFRFSIGHRSGLSRSRASCCWSLWSSAGCPGAALRRRFAEESVEGDGNDDDGDDELWGALLPERLAAGVSSSSAARSKSSSFHCTGLAHSLSTSLLSATMSSTDGLACGTLHASVPSPAPLFRFPSTPPLEVTAAGGGDGAASTATFSLLLSLGFAFFFDEAAGPTLFRHRYESLTSTSGDNLLALALLLRRRDWRRGCCCCCCCSVAAPTLAAFFFLPPRGDDDEAASGELVLLTVACFSARSIKTERLRIPRRCTGLLERSLRPLRPAIRYQACLTTRP